MHEQSVDMGISQYPLDFFSLSSKSYTVIGVVSLVAYLILVQVLRFHRVRSATRRYGYISKDAIEHMTQQDAEVITRNIGELEFPTVNELALQFALFRVCVPFRIFVCLLLRDDRNNQSIYPIY